jgi:hypothetical protein
MHEVPSACSDILVGAGDYQHEPTALGPKSLTKFRPISGRTRNQCRRHHALALHASPIAKPRSVFARGCDHHHQIGGRPRRPGSGAAGKVAQPARGLSPLRGSGECGRGEKCCPFQRACARRCTTRSLGPSSEITLIARGFELGALMRKRASAELLMRADSLGTAGYTDAGATPGLAISASFAASLNG